MRGWLTGLYTNSLTDKAMQCFPSELINNRVLFLKQIWEISCFYYKNISRCTVLWMSSLNFLSLKIVLIQLPTHQINRWLSTLNKFCIFLIFNIDSFNIFVHFSVNGRNRWSSYLLEGYWRWWMVTNLGLVTFGTYLWYLELSSVANEVC
jgi:hypothetical protein